MPPALIVNRTHVFGADKQLVAWNRNLQEMLDLPDSLLLVVRTLRSFSAIWPRAVSLVQLILRQS
jgi:hypothetical protein